MPQRRRSRSVQTSRQANAAHSRIRFHHEGTKHTEDAGSGGSANGHRRQWICLFFFHTESIIPLEARYNSSQTPKERFDREVSVMAKGKRKTTGKGKVKAKAKAKANDSEDYLNLADKHLKRVQEAWFTPDWSDLRASKSTR